MKCPNSSNHSSNKAKTQDQCLILYPLKERKYLPTLKKSLLPLEKLENGKTGQKIYILKKNSSHHCSLMDLEDTSVQMYLRRVTLGFQTM